MNTLDRICNTQKEKDEVLNYVEVFVRDNRGLQDFTDVKDDLLSSDIEKNMKAIEYVIGDVLFGRIILGCDVLSVSPNRMNYTSFETCYADYEVKFPAPTADDIAYFAIALYAWISVYE